MSCTFISCLAIESLNNYFPTKSAIEIIRGGFWRKSARSFAMPSLAIEVLADRSRM
jgi:hypothetical protein